jgi:hypothetical protein
MRLTGNKAVDAYIEVYAANVPAFFARLVDLAIASQRTDAQKLAGIKSVMDAWDTAKSDPVQTFLRLGAIKPDELAEAAKDAMSVAQKALIQVAGQLIEESIARDEAMLAAKQERKAAADAVLSAEAALPVEPKP